MPAFERLNNESLEGLQIICVNCMEDKATVDKFVKDNGYTFNIGYDENGAIEAYYPTDGIPYTLVINKGEISKIYVGAYDADKQYEEYKDAIEYKYLKTTCCNFLRRMLMIKDQKFRSEVIDESWALFVKKFPSWRKNKYLSKLTFINIYLRMMSPCFLNLLKVIVR